MKRTFVTIAMFLTAMLGSQVAIQVDAAAADTTKIIDGATQFHRLYVLGNGNDAAEDAAFANDLNELRGELEAGGRQAAGSSATTVNQPTIAELQTALNNLGAAAGPGDEITLYFSGHGGGAQTWGRADNVEGGEPDQADEHFRLRAGTSLYDDQLPGMLTAAGIPGANETLIVIFDSCYGGGFTGGANDLGETKAIQVIGPQGKCPLDPPKSWGRAFWVDTITEDIASKASEGGLISGGQVKTHLQGEGWAIGPPNGTEQKNVGKGKHDRCGDGGCAAGSNMPTTSAVPSNGASSYSSTVSGQHFGANSTVSLYLVSNGSYSGLGSFPVNGSGSFNANVAISGPTAGYLVASIDDQGYSHWTEVFIGGGGVGGFTELARLGESQVSASVSSTDHDERLAFSSFFRLSDQRSLWWTALAAVGYTGGLVVLTLFAAIRMRSSRRQRLKLLGGTHSRVADGN